MKTCRDGELKRYGLAISEVVDSLTGGDFCAGRAWWVRFGGQVIYAWGRYEIDTCNVRQVLSALVNLVSYSSGWRIWRCIGLDID